MIVAAGGPPSTIHLRERTKVTSIYTIDKRDSYQFDFYLKLETWLILRFLKFKANLSIDRLTQKLG